MAERRSLPVIERKAEQALKAILLMADAATSHPDGTFSLLRGGITEANVPKNVPIFFRGALVARIAAASGDSGKHEFRLKCVDEDGAPVGQELPGNFDVPQKGGTLQLVLNIDLVFPRHGRYEFSLAVDGNQLDSWTIQTKEAPPEAKK